MTLPAELIETTSPFVAADRPPVVHSPGKSLARHALVSSPRTAPRPRRVPQQNELQRSLPRYLLLEVERNQGPMRLSDSCQQQRRSAVQLDSGHTDGYATMKLAETADRPRGFRQNATRVTTDRMTRLRERACRRTDEAFLGDALIGLS